MQGSADEQSQGFSPKGRQRKAKRSQAAVAQRAPDAPLGSFDGDIQFANQVKMT